MPAQRLTETSYIVLGMLEFMQPATPYDLKRLASLSTTSFWTVSHSQLYTECGHLAKQGLLSEVREQTGRRRRVYSLTKAGLKALQAWRAEPGSAIIINLHDLSTLKLFLGADPAMLARAYLPEHEARLRHYESLRDVILSIEDAPRGTLLALEFGIGHVRENIRFWKRLLGQESKEEKTDAGGTTSGRRARTRTPDDRSSRRSTRDRKQA